MGPMDGRAPKTSRNCERNAPRLWCMMASCSPPARAGEESVGPLGRPGAQASERAVVESWGGAAQRRLSAVGFMPGVRPRIDAFMNRHSGEIIVIEANSLPGLTPSTFL